MTEGGLRLNAFKVRGGIPEGVRAHRVVIPRLMEDPFSTARNVGRELKRRYGGFLATRIEDGFPVLYLTVPIPRDLKSVTFTTRGERREALISYTGEKEVPAPIVRSLLEDAVRSRLEHLGYRRFRNLYYNPRRKILLWNKVNEFDEPYYVYQGLKYSVSLLGKDLLVFLDPRTVRLISLLDYVRMVRRTHSKEVAVKLLMDQNYRVKGWVVVPPRFTKGRIKEILIDEGPDYLLESPGITLADYWMDAYGIRLRDDDFPVRVVLEGGGGLSRRELVYPASRVFPTTKDIRAREVTGRYPPKERYKRTLSLAESVLRDPIDLGGREVSFDLRMVTVEEGMRRGFMSGSGVLEPPYLSFGNGGVGRSPKDLKYHGPYSGPLDISVIYAVPRGLSHKVKAFHSILAQVYRSYKLGSLRIAGMVEFDRSTDMREIGELIDERVEEMDGPRIGLAVVIDSRDKWEILKGGSKKKYLQFCKLDTFRRILEGSERERWSKATNLVIQMYFKAYPLTDRSPWILKEPADGSGSTVYVGFDISRRIKGSGPLGVIRERTEVAVRAAMCDPRVRLSG